MQTVRRSKPGALHLIGLCCTSFCVPILAMHVTCMVIISIPGLHAERYQHQATCWGMLSSGAQVATSAASCFHMEARNIPL